MEEARQLSNEELYETVKGFWGSNLPPFEDFEKCGKGLRADDKKKAWFAFVGIFKLRNAQRGLPIPPNNSRICTGFSSVITFYPSVL